jgi:K+-transporting ATPase KdpF subunit
MSETLINGGLLVVSALVFAYLLYTLLFPERF